MTRKIEPLGGARVVGVVQINQRQQQGRGRYCAVDIAASLQQRTCQFVLPRTRGEDRLEIEHPPIIWRDLCQRASR